MKVGSLVVACGVLVAGTASCSKGNRPVPEETPPPSVVASQQMAHAEANAPTGMEAPAVYPYPPARWRLVPFEELDRVTLWVGQIALRHEHSRTETLRAPGWEPDGPNPKRSLAQALAIAEDLHQRLSRAPDEFEALAREHSEDPVTKPLGGYLGGVRASQLGTTDFLDVLAALKPGEVSKPFQTPYGIHILKRYSPPAHREVAGERIVIGYAGVFGLGREAQRNRGEALALAHEVAERARQNPAKFRELVAQYSDGVDRAIYGDIGVYSTTDPGYLPLEVEGLSRVKVGEIYGPIDSRFGVEVLRRVPVVKRQLYAMTAIEAPLDTSLPDEDTAVNQARAETAKLQQVLATDPQRFEELQRARRSEKVRRWVYPQGDLGLTRALDELMPGQIGPEPVRYGNALLIVKRLEPKELPPEPPRLTELPNPSDPDYDALIGYNDGTQLAEAARAFVNELPRRGLALGPEPVDIIATTFDRLSTQLDRDRPDAAAARRAIHAAFASLEQKLDVDAYRQLTAAGRQWVIEQMMPSAPSGSSPATRRD
jgi:PPIC-type PPIASE domain